MIEVYFNSNLDLHPSEKWPQMVAFRPVVGDYIQSETRWDKYRDPLELRVCAVTLKSEFTGDFCTGQRLHVELSLKECHESTSQFQKWYRRLQGCA